MDDDIGWNDFALRNYDAQVGRWVQQDPFGQFASPYVGMGNDPANLIDPSGGIGIPCPGTSALSIFLENAVYAAGNMLNPVSRVYNIVGKAAAVTQTATVVIGAFEGSNTVNGQLQTNGVGNASQSSSASAGPENLTNNDSNNNDWQPLYKADLIRYVGSSDENLLGITFEKLFAKFSLTDPLMRATNVSPYEGKFTGGFRNTVPDFVGEAYVDEIKGGVKVTTIIKGADWYELKQKSGGLYLSSNEDQIAGHIDNIRNSTDYAYRKFGRLGYQSKLYIVTTADVKYSEDIYERAFKHSVLYEHIHAEYKIVNNIWHFRFKKTVVTTQKW